MSSVAPVIRGANLADAPAIAALFTELGYPNTPEKIARRLPRLLADDGHRVLVADDGAVIGCVHIGLFAILERDLSAQIMGLVVAATHHRRGVGRALIGAAEAWAQAQGCGTIYVRTNILRAEAPAFYRGVGYTHTKTQYAFRKALFASP